MNIFGKKQNEVKAKLADYTLTLYTNSSENPRIVYLNLGEYLASEIFLREKGGSFSLMVKCEDEKAEKEIYSFTNKKEAIAAVNEIAKAMLSSRGISSSRGGLLGLLKFLIKAALVVGVLVIAFGTYLNIVNQSKLVEGVSSKIESPENKQKGLQQEFLPEGKAVPLEDVVK